MFCQWIAQLSQRFQAHRSQVGEAFRRYDVDGVMIARACLGKPWLFAQAAALLKGEPIPPDPTLAEQRAVMLRHYDLVLDRFGDDRGTMLMRKFAACYAVGLPGARAFRGAIGDANSPAEFRDVVERLFPR